MRRNSTIAFILLFGKLAVGQVQFKSIVPPQPVIAGEAFQVQYVLEVAKKLVAINPPPFSGFRFVTGPNNYSGTVSTMNGLKSVYNAVYTLEAVRPGTFIIPGAAAIVSGKVYRSNDVKVQVISKQEALARFNKENETNNSDYFLRPGEDVYKKIRENLFVRVLVDKRACYTGESLLATFKLYSRLESRSDIIKNPGFYGFTVYDMVNLADRESTVENINGKKFDVHTIRKLQLFPLQPGQFTIDPMEVKNKVEFSRSVVHKKTEQEIVEGLLGEEEESHPAGTEVFETTMHTEPVSVRVKPIPARNKPDSFSGAVGHFSISASLRKEKLALNEQGVLEITILGQGNFVQLDAPAINWPGGLEGFPATVNDQLDKTKTPLAGSRSFLYTFVGTNQGNWKLDPISFSFFDIDSNSFKTIKTKPIKIEINPEIKKQENQESKETANKNKGKAGLLILSGALLIAAIGTYLFLIRKKTSVAGKHSIEEPPKTGQAILEPAYRALAMPGNDFYFLLHGLVWKFLGEKFQLSGSKMNKDLLASTMHERGIEAGNISELVSIIECCETGIFTGTDLASSREELFEKTCKLIDGIG